MARGIQLSYDTIDDLINDTHVVRNMTVYAVSLHSLGDGGGSYYKIIDKPYTVNPAIHFRLNNGLYAEAIETSTFNEQLNVLENLLKDAEESIGKLREIVGETDDELSNIAELIGEICDEAITIYSESFKLYNTSIGDTDVATLTPILDSDIDHIAEFIGEHEDTLYDISTQLYNMSDNITELSDYDYEARSRIRRLEEAVKAINPDFVPDEYPDEEEPEDPDNPNPDDPDNPDNPDDPDNPDNPDDPDNPDNPDNPNEPVNPDGSDDPDNPDEPVIPDNPDEPDNPDNPDEVNP